MWYSPEAAPSNKTVSILVDQLGCRVVCGETLLPEDPIANKIEAMCVPVDTPYSLWMDTDTYVLNTDRFMRLFDCNVDVAASGQSYHYQRWATFHDIPKWRLLYHLAGIEGEVREGRARVDNLPCNFYMNSGVVMVKNGRGFQQRWKDLACEVRRSGITDAQHNFTQTSLTLTALSTDSECFFLSDEFNCSYSAVGEEAMKSTILHYQDHIIDRPGVLWNVQDLYS
jgi:hypothetical protein